MPINKDSLLSRLEEMFWLDPDWDGFGTPPITQKAHDAAKQMIQYIDTDVSMRIFVSPEPEGGLLCEIRRPDDALFRFEVTVQPDGGIDYVEIRDYKVIAEGSLILTYETINDTLR